MVIGIRTQRHPGVIGTLTLVAVAHVALAVALDLSLLCEPCRAGAPCPPCITWGNAAAWAAAIAFGVAGGLLTRKKGS